MDKFKIYSFLNKKSDYFPKNKVNEIKFDLEELGGNDEAGWILEVNYKSPILAYFLPIVYGWLGVDSFLEENYKRGFTKLFLLLSYIVVYNFENIFWKLYSSMALIYLILMIIKDCYLASERTKEDNFELFKSNYEKIKDAMGWSKYSVTKVEDKQKKLFLNENELNDGGLVKEEEDIENVLSLSDEDECIDADRITSDDYLMLFGRVAKFDVDKEQTDEFLKKIKRNRDVIRENFIKTSITNSTSSDFVVFDLETTGLRATDSEIIEIGAYKFKNGMPVEYFHTYVKPTVSISKRIQRITGITDETVKDAPTIEDVLPKFVEFIEDYTLVAHNARFDMGFILENLYKFGYKKTKNKVVDTLALARKSLRMYGEEKLPSYKLEMLKYEFEFNNLGSHNALDDCIVCAFVYQKIIRANGDTCYVEEKYI